VHRHHDLRTNPRGRLSSLLRIHRVGAPHRQERHVALDRVHLGDQVCVPGVIDPPAARGDNIAHMSGRAWMIGLVRVVGRHDLDRYPCDLQLISGTYRACLPCRDLGDAVGRAQHYGRWPADALDVLRGEMIMVTMRHQDQVRLRTSLQLPGVDVDHGFANDAETGMSQPGHALQ